MLQDQARAATPDSVRSPRAPTVARQAVVSPAPRLPLPTRPRGFGQTFVHHVCRLNPDSQSLLPGLRARAHPAWRAARPSLSRLLRTEPMRRLRAFTVVASSPTRVRSKAQPLPSALSPAHSTLKRVPGHHVTGAVAAPRPLRDAALITSDDASPAALKQTPTPPGPTHIHSITDCNVKHAWTRMGNQQVRRLG